MDTDVNVPTNIAKAPGKPATTRLGQLGATAICGNDITSSCLYVAAISILAAGYLAPISLLVVVIVLYLYRKIYAEVGDALPLNGGAYNCLLNTTSKLKASIAACMTIVSYVATAVISAKTAVSYIGSISSFGHNLPLILGITVVVLSIFALLTIIGIGESAKVAIGIFIVHLISLVLFVTIGIVTVASDSSILMANLHHPLPGGHGIAVAIFFGFGAALLGVSGFESSANFIEEQRPGVFVKTLRNMWIAVSIFNPLIAVLALGVLPISSIRQDNADFLLSLMSTKMAGSSLAFWISIDAALVLCGAVLTSFIGVTGLVRRMTLDRCLPQALLQENRRGTNHRIVLVFLVLSVSILLLTRGDVVILGGVYAVAFLLVMSLFAVGNLLLKIRRSRLKRNHHAAAPIVVVALLATTAGTVATVLRDERNLWYFLMYFGVTVIFVGAMFWRIHLLRLLLLVVGTIGGRVNRWASRAIDHTQKQIEKINSIGVIFFTKGDNLANLNLAMLYVRENEQTSRVKVVHVLSPGTEPPTRLREDLALIDEIYPDIDIKLVLYEGAFGPAIIEKISAELHVAKNYMFIGAPGERFPHQLADLGGVRLII